MWLNTYFPNIVYLIRAEYKKWELEKINYTLKKILTKRLNFTSEFSTPRAQPAQGDGAHRLWMRPLPFPPPRWKNYSYSSPIPIWGLSHGRQSSMSFSNTSPFYGQQFFTAGASHRESNCSSVGSSLHGSTGPARPCCGTGILWAHSLGSSMACRWIYSPLWAPWPGWGQLPHHGLNHGLQGNLATQTHFAHWKLWMSKEEEIRDARAAGWYSASWGFKVIVKYSWCL